MGVGVTSGVGRGRRLLADDLDRLLVEASVPFDLVVPRDGVRAFRELEDTARRCTAVARGRVEESILDDRSVLVSPVNIECSGDRRVGQEVQVERAAVGGSPGATDSVLPSWTTTSTPLAGPARAAVAEKPSRPRARSDAVATPAKRLGGRFDLAVSIQSLQVERNKCAKDWTTVPSARPTGKIVISRLRISYPRSNKFQLLGVNSSHRL